MACLEPWNRERLLGQGSVGKVYLMCRRSRRCIAAKVVPLKTSRDRREFEQEVQTQRAFRPFAPAVQDACTTETKGFVLMERIDIELDEYLKVKRSESELKKVNEGLQTIFRFMVRHRYTHGDLALFNIARTRKKKWVLIDFGRASTTVFRPRVDGYRLVLELFRRTQSSGTANLHPDNVSWLLQQAVPTWLTILKTPFRFHSLADVDQAWVQAYQAYCRVAQVWCIGD